MFKKFLIFAVIFTLLLSACAPAATPTEAPKPAAPTEAPPAATEAPAQATQPPAAPSGEVVKAVPGQAMKMVLLPKFLGNAVFDQAHEGAEEAAKELQNSEALQFLGPTPENSVTGQIEIVTNSTRRIVAMSFCEPRSW